jgi:alanine-synthesizing transaminase
MYRLPPYSFGEINRLKAQMRRDGVDVIDMAMGNPTDPTPVMIVEKLCEVVQDPRNHRYSVAGGIYNLRREVATYYRDLYDVELEPEEEVVATIGSKEGFSHLCLALLGPGDTAIVPTPSFPIHAYGVVIAGGNIIGLPIQDDEEFLRRLTETCASLIPTPKALMLNYPHNPTAHTVEPAFFGEVVKIARRFHLAVVHDFAYGRTTFDGYTAPSFLQTPGAKAIGVEFSTMSKPFNMAGWRIGFCVGNRELVQGLARIKGYYDYGIFQAIQIASIVGLRHCQDEVARQAAIYQERRDVLISGLARMGWKVEPPRGAMFVWAPIPGEFRHMGSAEFARRLMKEAAVAMVPGASFGPEGEGAVRLALVENCQRIQQAVRQIRRVFRRWRQEGLSHPEALRAGA